MFYQKEVILSQKITRNPQKPIAHLQKNEKWKQAVLDSYAEFIRYFSDINTCYNADIESCTI